MGKYPWNSPYAFSENRVIDAVELEGLESVRSRSYGVGPAYTPQMRVIRGGKYVESPQQRIFLAPYGQETVGAADNFDRFWLTLARLLDPSSGSNVVLDQTQASLDQNIALVEFLGPAQISSSFRDLPRISEAYRRVGEGTATGADFNIINDERAQAIQRDYESRGEFAIIEQHHIIPQALRSHPVVKAAIRNGYEFDGAENLMPLLAFRIEKQPEGVHANHPQYNLYVRKRLDDLGTEYSDEDATNLLKNLSLSLRAQVESNSTEKVNDVGKKLLQNNE